MGHTDMGLEVERETAKNMKWLLSSNAPAATLLIRLLVGAVFLSEGVQKFLFPNELGVGRFARIGIPAPEVMGPFVGGIEVVAGSLLLLARGRYLLTHSSRGGEQDRAGAG